MQDGFLRLRVVARESELAGAAPHRVEPRAVGCELVQRASEVARIARLEGEPDLLGLDQAREIGQTWCDNGQPRHHVLEQLVREHKLVVPRNWAVDDEADIELRQGCHEIGGGDRVEHECDMLHATRHDLCP